MDFISNLTNNFGQVLAQEILNALAKPRTYSLLLNTNKLNDSVFTNNFPDLIPHPITKNGYLFDNQKYEFGKHYLHDLGAYYLQEPAAMSVVSILGIKQGYFVLDMCAAPGGKTIQASLLLGKSGIVIANDLSHKRALVLSQNIERMGLENVVVTNNDFSCIYQYFENTFDRIILDAPCSGSGMFRKDEKMIEDWSINKVLACQKTQISLLQIAYSMLKPGGTLAYSTCSFSKEENEDVIANFLTSNNAVLQKITHPELYNSPNLHECVYFLPSRFAGEGHFLALINKPGLLVATNFTSSSYKGPYQDLLKNYGLDKRHNISLDGALYSLPFAFSYRKMNVLRYGIRCFEEENHHIKPHHHLAHFLQTEQAIPLNQVQFTNYMAGEVLKYQTNDGFHLVSFKGINAGWVKSSNGVLKNLLPKGLRRR